uniref:Bcl-2-like protein 12 n=1 Tax=Camelus bactrianus TaxID=9837 RepID=A0A9W3HBF4_CAMBA|nr:bcl-2-like protein 12 [Camelus bactrianus]
MQIRREPALRPQPLGRHQPSPVRRRGKVHLRKESLYKFKGEGGGGGDRDQVPFPRSPTQEEPTDFLSRLRRCLPCSLGRGAVPPESPRPCSLPLRPCYGSEPGPATPDFYALVAQRLEQLVQEQLKSPPSPELQGPPPTEKEALLRKLVALLEEEAEVINQKLASDPALRRKPLARLALAMELSRRVAGLGGTLTGLSVEHVHSFAPWIQAHGGWEGILAASPVDLNLPLD